MARAQKVHPYRLRLQESRIDASRDRCSPHTRGAVDRAQSRIDGLGTKKGGEAS